MDAITLTRFVHEMHEHMKRFEEHYRKQHEKNPEHWPLVMAPGDWDEQLMLFKE